MPKLRAGPGAGGSRWRWWEGGVGELGAEGGDDRGDVDVFVGVDAEDDLLQIWFRVGLVGPSGGVWVGHPGHGVFVLSMAGRMAIAGPVGRSEL